MVERFCEGKRQKEGLRGRKITERGGEKEKEREREKKREREKIARTGMQKKSSRKVHHCLCLSLCSFLYVFISSFFVIFPIFILCLIMLGSGEGKYFKWRQVTESYAWEISLYHLSPTS